MPPRVDRGRPQGGPVPFRGVHRVVGNAVALAAVLVTNALANALPIGGRTTGEVSARFPTLVTPAPYAFGIWGLIYAGLLAFVAFQAFPTARDNPRLHALDPWFVLSCLFNVSWLLAWHHLRIGVSLVLMIGLLACLIMAYRSLEIGWVTVPRAERVAVRWPFSLYLGWITVATVANVAIALRAAGWQGWGVPFGLWAVVVLLAIGALGVTVLWVRRDRVFALVLVWAAVAIAAARPDATAVVVAAAGVAMVLLAVLGVPWFRGAAT